MEEAVMLSDAHHRPHSFFPALRIPAFFATLSRLDFSIAPTFKFVDESIY
jgi:hypothetical protein